MEALPASKPLASPAAQPEELLAAEMEELAFSGPDLQKEASNKQTVLITGHAGFIGFHTAKALLERGDKVIGFDSLNSHYDTRLKRERLLMLEEIAKATGSKYHSVRADLCDATELHECLETYKVQRVIHLAGQTDKFLSHEKPVECVQNNINSFVSLLEACRHFKIHHLTYASSHAVYGAGFQKPMSERDCASHPQRLDAAAQRACELMAHSYSHQFRLPTTGLRFFSVYGPWGRPDSVLFSFIRKILEGKPIQIYNDGSNTRDYTYIADVVEAILRASDTPAEPNPSWLSEMPDQASSNAPWQIFNVGNCRAVSIDELVRALETSLEKRAITELITGPILEKSQSCADNSLLAKATGFRPNTDIQTGVNELVQWYRTFYQV
ncbi:MAG TPA: NAD-dependent epimerase/dehydratase family protein [Limnobacter sp.]|nr:NAD-dependent epimerase/dehydratase family protein [Limnobacter sp.]